MLNGVKIWQGDVNEKDCYVDFRGCFSYAGSAQVFLRVSCDSNFSAEINGVIAGFGVCSDYPERRKYFQFDVTGCLRAENEILVTVWHYGVGSQTYTPGEAFLMFDVVSDGKTLLKSNASVLSRRNLNYRNGYLKTITGQLGLSFYYDNTVVNSLPWLPSHELGVGSAEARETKPLKLMNRSEAVVSEADDGYLIDLLKETAGFLELDFESVEEQEILISYGEHLRDGKPARFIGGRDFSVEFKAKAGENKYINAFRRLAGRYIFVYGKNLKINYVGIRPAVYPDKLLPAEFGSDRLQKIYDTGVYTLTCCKHEHYEDCPWREQALYVLDSRNQMLCGYYAFVGYEYQRENILLMADGLRSDGLLAMCFPSGSSRSIPFFSLMYPVVVEEYINHTGDREILGRIGGVLSSIMEAFKSRLENGLIPNFPAPYWNFYEWSDCSSNSDELDRVEGESCVKQYDLILNCAYVYAARRYDRIFGTETDCSKTVRAIENMFLRKDGLYRLSSACDRSSVLGNAFALLIGLGGKPLAERIINDKSLIPVTLSMCTFYYDALLSFGKSYESVVLDDILQKYGKMLDAGATTFWETEKGSEDFGGAGSLCHGWSAIPVYYLKKLQIGRSL